MIYRLAYIRTNNNERNGVFMSEVPEDLKYTEEHEWVKKEDGNVRYGVTDFAQEELGDIVYVELPEEGDELEKGDMLGVVESVKTVSDLYSPIGGKIIGVNEDLLDTPSMINEDPFGEGWIAIIELSDEAGMESLMSAEEYKLHIE